jgi:hypothetical protein
LAANRLVASEFSCAGLSPRRKIAPFSAFHVAVILVLGLVGFIDGYDLALTGSLLVLAKGPLHITPDQIRWLTIAAMRVFGAIIFSQPLLMWAGQSQTPERGGVRAQLIGD